MNESKNESKNKTIEKSLGTNLTLAQKMKIKKNQPCLLLDVSGSMASELEPGQSKIQALKGIIKGVKGSPPMFAFNTTCYPTKGDTEMQARGGTLMAIALNHIKNLGYKKVVMITDGIANDPSQALEAVKGLDLEILYVGPEPKPSFLDKLANGYCTQEDLKNQQYLTNKIQLLLGEGSKREAIQL